MTPRSRRALSTVGLLFLLATPADADTAWRRAITFQNPLPNAILDVAWPVVLTPANFDYGHTDPAGAFLYFTAADGITGLTHYVETWNPGGTSVVWVKVPSLAANSTTTLDMFYGAVIPSAPNFNLTFPNAYVLSSGSAFLSGSHTYDWFEIGAGATLIVDFNGLEVVARRVIVKGTVQASAAILPGGAFPSNGNGPGAGRYQDGFCSGGGHGGGGGTSAFSIPAGGITYGDTGENTIEAGSSGGNNAGSATGGSGGGKVKMVARRMDVTGVIAANAGAAAIGGGSGGGSGGGILLKAFDLVATGTLSAQGSAGGGGSYGGGGGGGGRIKVAYQGSVSGTPTMSVTGGAGGDGSFAGGAGADGTTLFGQSAESTVGPATIGSEVAIEPTALPATSWGKVKALYRR